MLVGLDIGTSQIIAVAGESTDAGIRIAGMAAIPSAGVRQGLIVDMDAAVSAVRQVLGDLQRQVPLRRPRIYAGISGSHVSGVEAVGKVAIQHQEIKPLDLAAVREAVRRTQEAEDREIIHILPQEYLIDDQPGIIDPIGLCGHELALHAYLVSAQSNNVQNLANCLQESGVTVESLVFNPVADACALLSQDEKDLGASVVNIGAGTTDFCVYHRGAIRHCGVIPIAGDQISKDVALVFRTTLREAELLKKRYACAISALADARETASIQRLGNAGKIRVSRRNLAEVVEQRLAELFVLLGQQLSPARESGQLAAGVVITGGSAWMEGVVELAEEILRIPVRVGIPDVDADLAEVMRNPVYATGVGLLYSGQSRELQQNYQRKGKARGGKARQVVENVKNWFVDNF